MQEMTQNSMMLKKYLIKRKQLREEAIECNESIFKVSKDNELSTFLEKDPFKKYQTLTTNLQNSISVNQVNEESASTHLKTQRQYTQEILPKINILSKHSYGNHSLLNTVQSEMPAIKLRTKELIHHHSDPVYLKIQKTISRRVQQKFGKYKRGWVNSCTKRKSRSILERSTEKASQIIESINVDAAKRKNTTHLEQMLRNNIDEKTFIFPAARNPEIEGLKGRGGRAISLFQQIYVTEQVYKKHPIVR